MSASVRDETAKTAFVFAGGGSFGAIQVGMLHSLVANGVTADMVVGSSVGAINGADGARDWRTVWDANKGRAEPGGKRFTDPDHIEVGWTLTVPAASKGAAAPPAPAQAASAAPAPAAGDDGATPAETAPVAPQPQTPPAPASAAGVAPGAAVGSTHRQGPLEQQDSLTESGASSPTPASSVGAPVPPATPASPAQPGADRAGADSSAGVDGASSGPKTGLWPPSRGTWPAARSWRPGFWPRWSWCGGSSGGSGGPVGPSRRHRRR